MGDKATVYFWKVWNQNLGENVIAPRPGTLEAIKHAQGSPITDTAMEIDAADLDGDGFRRKDLPPL